MSLLRSADEFRVCLMSKEAARECPLLECPLRLLRLLISEFLDVMETRMSNDEFLEWHLWYPWVCGIEELVEWALGIPEGEFGGGVGSGTLTIDPGLVPPFSSGLEPPFPVFASCVGTTKHYYYDIELGIFKDKN